jgi:hypothetical protein
MTHCKQQVIALIMALLFVLSFTSFAQDIELPRTVPAFNQAYNEGPDAWGACPLGTVGCPDDVCTTGCLVTAFSSVLAYYEIDVSVSARYSCTGQRRTGMDPGIFNDWLRETGGYGQCSQDPVGNCCLIWGQLPAELEITTHVNRSDVGLNPVASVVIDHALRQGYVVVAGVHWGAFCNGGLTQSEDCHWVILTGKKNNSYTIIDPFNPDPSSPDGIRTTLDAGVHGSYIIDRYVIVEGPAPGDIDLLIGTDPENTVHVGARIQLTMSTPRTSAALTPYARVTKPSGLVAYMIMDGSTLTAPRYVTSRQSLVSTPRLLSSEWTWFDTVATESDIGRWTWEIWAERADEPGTKLGRQTISYDVEPATSATSVGAAILGVLLVVAIAAVAFISVLGTGLLE